MSKYLNLDGLGTFWTKIKNTFVKKNDNGYIANNQIPVKTYRAGGSRAYVRICRCKAPTSSISPTIDCNIRMGDATVRVIIQGYNGWRANVIGYLNNTSFKFYAHQVVVEEETFYDIIAYHTTYCRGFYSAQFLYDYDVMDFSYWAAPYTEYTPTSEEEIPYIMLAKSTASSSNAPVKVNAYGDLSPITVDSTPTAGNTANLVSSDGIKTALDLKADASDIPPAVSVKGNAESSYRTGQVNLTPANLGISATTTSVSVGSTTASIPQASSTTPKMDSGSGSAGSGTTWAKGDHVHPTDTSREAAANKKTSLDSSSNTDFPTSKAVATYVGTTVSGAINALDVAEVGGTGKYIKAISESNGKIDATEETMDTTPTVSSTKAVTSGGVKSALDKSSDVIVTYNTESSRTHKYWKFAEATFSGKSRYLFSEWDVILQTNATFYPFKLIFETYKKSSTSISVRYAKIVDVKSDTTEDALGTTEFYVKTQDGTDSPLIIELWCGLNRDSQASIAIKELRAGLASSSNEAIDTRANSWTYYPNDGSITTSTTKPVTGDGYTVTQFTQMSDKFSYYAERIGKPSDEDGSSVVTSQVGSTSIPIYIKSDGSIDECDVKSTYIATGTGSDAPVNGQAVAAALAGETAKAASANKLKTARNLAVSLSNTTTDTSFDGSKAVTNIKVSGILPVANGGTGQNSLASVTVGKATNADITRTADTANGDKLRIGNGTEATIVNAKHAATADKMSTAAGDTNKPVYIAADGTVTAGSTYAAGTAVTLNGTSKSASTASFYAPTTAGDSGKLLKSSGSGAPTWATANASLVGITVTSTSVSDGTNTFNKYVHPTDSGNKHIPSGGQSGQFLGWAADGTAKWVANPNTDKVTQTKDDSGTTEYPLLMAGATNPDGSATTARYDSGVKLNPSTNTITANISGTAATATSATNVNLVGDVKTPSTTNGDTIRVKAGSGTAAEITIINAKHAASADSATSATSATTATNSTKSAVTADTSSKLYIIGSTGSSGQQALKTDTGIYATTNSGELHATKFDVNGGCTLQYNSTTKSLDFVFA